MKTFKRITLIITLATSAILAGCGSRVEVPPAHVGKILKPSGYAPETYTPSKFRLAYCAPWNACERLVLLEASDVGINEEMRVYMPKDKLNIAVNIRGTITVPTDQATVDKLFDRVTTNENGVIPSAKVYVNYGQPAIRGIVASEMAKYTILDLMTNREAISANIHAAIINKLKVTKTPIELSRFELADIQPPKIIVDAQEATKKREVDIQRANADAEVKMVEAQRALDVAKKDRLVKREQAEALAEQNKIAAASITPQMLRNKELDIQYEVGLALAKSSNTIIVPVDMGATGDTAATSAIFGKVFGKEINVAK